MPTRTDVTQVTAYIDGSRIIYFLPRIYARQLYAEGKLNIVGDSFSMQVPG